MTVQEENAVVEVSLGGRVDSHEMRAFAEEVEDLLESLGTNHFYLLIDHSKAKSFDGETSMILAQFKDRAIDLGAEKIVTLATDENDVARQTTSRLQQVLEGVEQFCLELPELKYPVWQRAAVLRAA